MADFFEQPILNSPYERPARHWELDENRQPTNRRVDARLLHHAHPDAAQTATPIGGDGVRPRRRGGRLLQQRGAFCLDTTPEQLPAALFQLGQALTRICDLTFLSRSNVGSTASRRRRKPPTFYDDLADCLRKLVDESKVERYYQLDVPNTKAYTVDYRIEGREVLLFLFDVPNRGKARLTAIMLSHYHRYELAFESIIVFEDQPQCRALTSLSYRTWVVT